MSVITDVLSQTFNILYRTDSSRYGVWNLAKFVSQQGKYIKARERYSGDELLLAEKDIFFNRPPRIENLSPGLKVLAPISVGKGNMPIYINSVVSKVKESHVELAPLSK